MKRYLNIALLTFMVAFVTSCKDDCELSEVVDAKGCILTEVGEACTILFKNGKWGIGPELKVGTRACSKTFKGI